MNRYDVVFWAFLIILVLILVWGLVETARDRNKGPDYLKLCGVIIVGVFVFVAAEMGLTDLFQSLLSITKETAEKISRSLLVFCFIAVYIYFKNRKKR